MKKVLVFDHRIRCPFYHFAVSRTLYSLLYLSLPYRFVVYHVVIEWKPNVTHNLYCTLLEVHCSKQLNR